MAVCKHITPGQKFGRLTVIEEVPTFVVNGRRRRRLTARCECGTVKDYAAEKLWGGQVSCGCYKPEPPNKLTFELGQRFGRMVYIREAISGEGWQRRIVTRCDCGIVSELSAENVVSGNTKSCGCLHRERASLRLKIRKTTHGMTGTPEFVSWTCAINRCHNPKDEHYPNYGARGIVVCERWRESFENFYADMGTRPQGMTLDRFPDVNGPYSPENCRWATNVEQSNNKRNNRYVTRDGRTQTIAQWAREFGIYDSLVSKRRAAGWPEDRWFEPSQAPKK